MMVGKIALKRVVFTLWSYMIFSSVFLGVIGGKRQEQRTNAFQMDVLRL
jgi:hypothetical protein